MIRPFWRELPATALLFTVIVIDLIGFGIVIPILPFMAPALGGTETDVAVIIALYSLCAGLLSPFWGGLSDRIGRKRVLVFCLLGSSASYVVLAHAETLPWLYAARALGGVMAGTLPVASALFADVSTPERRAKAMGLVGTAFGLGLILGPLIGGLLAGDGEGFMLAGLMAAAMSLLAALLAGIILPSHTRLVPLTKPADSLKSSLWQFVTRHNARLLISQYGLHTVAISGAIYLTPLWLAAEVGWGPREIGLIFGAVGVAMILIQGVFLETLTRRFGVLPVLSTGAAIFFGGMLLTVFAESLWMYAGVILILFSGATCCLPMLNTLSTSIVDQSERGRMMGATTLVSSGGRVLGPLLAGMVLTHAGFSATWLVLVVPVLLVFIWSQTAAKLDVKRMHGYG